MPQGYTTPSGTTRYVSAPPRDKFFVARSTSAKQPMYPAGCRGPVGKAIVSHYEPSPDRAPAFAELHQQAGVPPVATIAIADTSGLGATCSRTHPVTPDSFRGPPRGEEGGRRRRHACAARWTPEPVRGDEPDEKTSRASSPQPYAIALQSVVTALSGNTPPLKSPLRPATAASHSRRPRWCPPTPPAPRRSGRGNAARPPSARYPTAPRRRTAATPPPRRSSSG